MTLFAIYKNGFHKGNERAKSGEEAITKYIIASDLKEFAFEMDFVKQYSFQIAIASVHYYEQIK
jgi:hypothetical protein